MKARNNLFYKLEKNHPSFKMQRLRARSQVRLYDKDLLPSLKTNSASFMGRTIVPISKFDLDSNVMVKEQRRLKMMSKIDLSQNSSKQKPRSNKNFIQSFLPGESGYKIATSDSKRQISQDNFEDLLQRYPSKNLVNLELSKTSSKSYGAIKGYAANSHPGTYNLSNQDRICIVTNLNKTNIKPKQISFFSIYDGSNGLLKADYFRDNFHLILNSQQDLMTDPERAIKNTIQKIQKNLSSHILYMEDMSKVGYSILVTIGEVGYIVVCGVCRAFVSKNFAQTIEKVNLINQNKNVSKIQLAKKNFLKKDQTINILVKKVSIQTDLDFIVLGSEGLFENMNEEEVCKKLWSHMLRSKHENIHSCLGQAILTLLYTVFGLPSTKNASVIILGFKNVENCLKKTQKLSLPYIQD